MGQLAEAGPGDQLILVITGDVELACTLDGSREGFIVISDVGQVSVNGPTLEQLEDRLFDRLGKVYSGVRWRRDATTQFSVSIGQLRRDLVSFLGEAFSRGIFSLDDVRTDDVVAGLGEAGARHQNRRIRFR